MDRNIYKSMLLQFLMNFSTIREADILSHRGYTYIFTFIIVSCDFRFTHAVDIGTIPWCSF